MREELENPDLMEKRIKEDKEKSDFIQITKKRFKKEGKNFWKEFEQWKKENNPCN